MTTRFSILAPTPDAQRTLDASRGLFAARSPHWHVIQHQCILRDGCCQWCGGVEALEGHHIEPYHVNPANELNPLNVITLCMHPTTECHLRQGHRSAHSPKGNWKDFNPSVVEEARQHRATFKAQCTRPPSGWSCTREPGHDGPCAAVPTDRPSRRTFITNVLVFGSLSLFASHADAHAHDALWASRLRVLEYRISNSTGEHAQQLMHEHNELIRSL